MFWYVLPLVLDSIQDSYDLYAKNRSLLMTTKAKKKKKNSDNRRNNVKK